MPRDQRGHARGLPLGSALDIEPFLQRDLRNQNEHDHAGKICWSLAGLAAIAGGKPARVDPGIIRDQQRGTATAIDEPSFRPVRRCQPSGVIFSREPTALRPLLSAAAVGIARNRPRAERITTPRSKASTIFGARDQT